MNDKSRNLTAPSFEPTDVPHVLIEMANLHDRQFASAWLLKMVETRWLWRATLHDPAFESLARIWKELQIGYFGEYLVCSIWYAQHPLSDFTSDVAVYDLEKHSRHFGAEFAILVQLGFFVLSGQFYHPSIPESVTIEAVQQAALKVALTATGIGKRQVVHPERMLQVLPEDEVDALVSFDSKGVGRRRHLM
jgi:hypothetical protein